MASKKQQPDLAPKDGLVTPTKTKNRIPADQVRLGLTAEALQQLEADLKPPFGGAGLGLSKDQWQALADAAKPPKALMEELARSSERLARIQVSSLRDIATEVRPIPVPMPPEVVISRVLREEIGNLSEITRAVNTQMETILTIASQVGPALKDYADKAEKSSRSLNWLTAALVGLTAVLAIPVVAEFLGVIAEFLRALTTQP